MKKTILSLTGLFMLVACSNLAFGQLANNGGYSGSDGGKCKINSGPNGGKSGTYDGGWCCTGANGGGDCTECVDASGKSNGKCSDALTKPIVTTYGISGNWSVAIKGTTTTKTTGTLTLAKNTFSVAIASIGRTAATGVLIDKNTIRITYPNSKISLFGNIVSATRIEWSDGSVWTKVATK